MSNPSATLVSDYKLKAGTPHNQRRVRRASAFALAVLGLLMLIPGVASARSPWNNNNNNNSYGDFERPGLYVGGGVVGGFTTRLEGELTEIPGVDNVEVDPTAGLSARIGARITPRLAVEAHYEWMDDFETSVSGVQISETRTSALTADVKGYLSTGRIQPFLTAGAGFLSAKSDDPVTNFQKTDTDFAARFGGGVDFYLTEVVGLSVDTSYVVPTGDVKNLDYVSVGAGVFLRF